MKFADRRFILQILPVLNQSNGPVAEAAGPFDITISIANRVYSTNGISAAVTDKWEKPRKAAQLSQILRAQPLLYPAQPAIPL